MKKIFSLSILLLHVLGAFAQFNILPNGGFEANDALTINEVCQYEVDHWTAQGQPEVIQQRYCGVGNNQPPVNAWQGKYFAALEEGSKLVNVLARPLYPGQKINITFNAQVSPCAACPVYLAHFSLLSNALPNNCTPQNYILPDIGIKVINSTTWSPTFLAAQDPSGSGAIQLWVPATSACAYTSLVVYTTDLCSPGYAGPESSVPANEVFFDAISVNECLSDQSAAFSYMNEVGGVCNRVAFAAQSIVSGNKYFWDFGDGTCGTGSSPVHTYANQGTYKVKLAIVDANGCVSRSESNVWVSCAPCEGMDAEFTFDCGTCTPRFLEFEGEQIFDGWDCLFKLTSTSTWGMEPNNVTYEWTFDGQPVNSTMPGVAIVNYPVLYEIGGIFPQAYEACLSISDVNGCSSIECRDIYLPCGLDDWMVAPPSPDADLVVYPNPASESLTIVVPAEVAELGGTLRIFDLEGKLVQEIAANPHEPAVPVDLSAYADGLYIVALQAPHTTYWQKVMVKR